MRDNADRLVGRGIDDDVVLPGPGMPELHSPVAQVVGSRVVDFDVDTGAAHRRYVDPAAILEPQIVCGRVHGVAGRVIPVDYEIVNAADAVLEVRPVPGHLGAKPRHVDRVELDASAQGIRSLGREVRIAAIQNEGLRLRKPPIGFLDEEPPECLRFALARCAEQLVELRRDKGGLRVQADAKAFPGCEYEPRAPSRRVARVGNILRGLRPQVGLPVDHIRLVVRVPAG